MCKSPEIILPRYYGSKHQRRAPVDEETTEMCVRKRSLQSVNLNVCVNMTNLRIINLSCNKLSVLPASITLIDTLEKLYVNGNQLVELPRDIGRLRNLKVLDCSSNRLRCLPESIKDLRQLEVLRIGAAGGGNMISFLPDTIGNLRELTELQLDNNELVELPHSITRLHRLHTLHAKSNRLTGLPENLGNMQSLTWVDVSHNILISLPKSLAVARSRGACKLRMLNVSFNQLQSVAHELCRRTSTTTSQADCELTFIIAGNPLLSSESAIVPACEPATKRQSSVRSLLEMALHVCAEEARPGALEISSLPCELQDLLADAPRCSVCACRCINTITEPRVVRVRALGYAHVPAEVAALCHPCSVATGACDTCTSQQPPEPQQQTTNP